MVGILVSFRGGLFPVALLVSGRVVEHISYIECLGLVAPPCNRGIPDPPKVSSSCWWLGRGYIQYYRPKSYTLKGYNGWTLKMMVSNMNPRISRGPPFSGAKWCKIFIFGGVTEKNATESHDGWKIRSGFHLKFGKFSEVYNRCEKLPGSIPHHGMWSDVVVVLEDYLNISMSVD